MKWEMRWEGFSAMGGKEKKTNKIKQKKKNRETKK